MVYREGQYWKNDLMLLFLKEHDKRVAEVTNVRLKEDGDSFGGAMEQFIVDYAAQLYYHDREGSPLGEEDAVPINLENKTCLVSVRAFQMFCRDEKPIIWM